MNRSQHDKDSLIIDRKQASRIVSASLLCAFFIFISGYFWGKKKAVEELTSSFEQQAISDKLNISNINSFSPEVAQEKMQAVNDNDKEVILTKQEDELQNLNEARELFVAQLCGFGTKKAAQQMIDRLKKAGITTILVMRESKPANKNISNRKMIQWYQVLSEQYADKNQLAALVDAVKRLEKIHDVQIVKVNNGKARETA
jgi:hypothetical protein